MRQINIKEVVEKAELDIKEVAEHLFPGNIHAKLALNRVIKGEALLDADQISKLASMANVSISDLYSGGNWEIENKDNLHIFTNSEFKAELDTKTNITKVFHKNSLFHESVIFPGATPINEFLKQLNLIIDKYKNNEQNKN